MKKELRVAIKSIAESFRRREKNEKEEHRREYCGLMAEVLEDALHSWRWEDE